MADRSGSSGKRITHFFKPPRSKRHEDHDSDDSDDPSTIELNYETDGSDENPDSTDNNSSCLMLEGTSAQSNTHDKDPYHGIEGALSSFDQGFSSYQPKVCFPRNLKGRTFQSKWYGSFKWLEYSPKLDKAFCFFCRLFGRTGQYDSAFVHKGFQNWKDPLQKFRVHEKSIPHTMAAEKLQTTAQVRSNPDRDVRFQINEQHRAIGVSMFLQAPGHINIH